MAIINAKKIRDGTRARKSRQSLTFDKISMKFLNNALDAIANAFWFGAAL